MMTNLKTKNVIILIHGINWEVKSDWLSTWAEILTDEDTNVLVCRYGKVYAVSSWLMNFKWFRKLQDNFDFGGYEKKLIGIIKNAEKEFPRAEISILAHSFGGWVTQKALEKMQDFRLNSIVFMHCPISSHIQKSNYRNWLNFGHIKKVYSWFSKKDHVIGKVAMPPFGKQGYFGFIRNGIEEDYIKPPEKPYNSLEIYNFDDDEEHSEMWSKPEKYKDILKGHLT